MITNLVKLAFLVGLLIVPVIAGAAAWARDLSLRMPWWKWLLVIVWYLLLLFIVLAGFTFVGEGERAAGLNMVLFGVVALIILGAGLVRIILAGRHRDF